jgi:hypothetical protein
MPAPRVRSDRRHSSRATSWLQRDPAATGSDEEVEVEWNAIAQADQSDSPTDSETDSETETETETDNDSDDYYYNNEARAARAYADLDSDGPWSARQNQERNGPTLAEGARRVRSNPGRTQGTL